MLITFADTLRKISPPWLQRGVARKISKVVGDQIDMLLAWTVAGIKLQFPGVNNYESLGLNGRQRRIRRGRTETDANYASRQTKWLDVNGHPTRGGPYALLAQLYGYYAPSNFVTWLIYNSGRRFTLATNGTVTYGNMSAWTSDIPTMWARWWLIFPWANALTTDGVWSDSGTWSDGSVWDSNLVGQEVSDLRLIPNEWNAAHAFGYVILLNSGVELWDYPAGAWSAPGNWGDGTGFATIAV